MESVPAVSLTEIAELANEHSYAEFKTLVALRARANGGPLTIGQRELAKVANVSLSNVIPALRALEDRGRIRRTGGGKRGPTTYEVLVLPSVVPLEPAPFLGAPVEKLHLFQEHPAPETGTPARQAAPILGAPSNEVSVTSGENARPENCFTLARSLAANSEREERESVRAAAQEFLGIVKPLTDPKLGEILTLAREKIGNNPLPQLRAWFCFVREDRPRRKQRRVENLAGLVKMIQDGDLETWRNGTLVRKPPQSEPLPAMSVEEEIKINEQFLEVFPEHPHNDQLRERTAMLRRQVQARAAGAAS